MKGSEEFSWSALIGLFSWHHMRRRLLSLRVAVLLIHHETSVTRPAHSVILISAADHLHLRKQNKRCCELSLLPTGWGCDMERFCCESKTQTLCLSRCQFFSQLEIFLSSPLFQLRVFWCRQLLWSTACRRRSVLPRSLLEAPDSGCYRRAAQTQGSKVINTAQYLCKQK